VDAADYTVWKDNFGSNTALAADGNLNGVVDAADYTIWKDNFGFAAAANLAIAVPEPAALCMITTILTMVCLLRRRTRMY
ncbi:MAG: PEP-CTERM sorting domain-containing protein, partial [Planctomycetales bacterium]|nr:PEP-CTERM sorting domain-containing protein [Planctomycetales bacterium]